MDEIEKLAWNDGRSGARVADTPRRRCAMTLTDQEFESDLDRGEPRLSGAWLTAAERQCECPAFCAVEHDNDN
jgi:hypothetical protein